MKTATSLVVSVIVSSVLEECLIMRVAHGNVVEPGQDVADVVRRVIARKVRRRWSAPRLELAMEVVTHIDHCFVVSDMPKALAE